MKQSPGNDKSTTKTISSVDTTGVSNFQQSILFSITHIETNETSQLIFNQLQPTTTNQFQIYRRHLILLFFEIATTKNGRHQR